MKKLHIDTVYTAMRIYLAFAIMVFSLTAVAKLLSDFTDPRLLGPDPFLSFISAKQLLIAIAIVEIGVVIFLLRVFTSNTNGGVSVVVWLSSLFVLYRVGFQFAPENAGACKCFGVGSILGKMEPVADTLSLVLLLLLLSSGGFLMWIHAKCRPKYNHKPASGVQTAIVALLLTPSVMAAQDSFSPVFSAEGHVDEQVLKSSGEINSTNSFPFKVMVGDSGQWSMTWQMYHPQWSARVTEIISYNGKDVFSVVYADKRLDANMKPVPNLPLEANSHPARVCRGPFPVDHSSCIGLLWLTFVGGEYLSRGSSDKIPDLLVAKARTNPGAWRSDLDFKFHEEDGSRLISSCSFILDPSKVSSDLLDYPEVDEPGIPERVEELLQEIKRLKATKELLRSNYVLERSELHEGVRIPMEFSATRYSRPGTAAGHYAMVKWNGTVTNIIIAPGPTELLPPILGKLTVEDRRFKERTEDKYLNNWFYELPGDEWVVSINDRSFLGTTNQVSFNVRQSLVARRLGFYLSVILFALVILLPIYALIRKRKAGGLSIISEYLNGKKEDDKR